MALSCRNLFSNAELINRFKQGLPDATRSHLDNNLRGLPASTPRYLDCVKQYVVTAGMVARACQARSVSTSTLITPRKRGQAVQHVPDNLFMDSFKTTSRTSLSSTFPSTPHSVDSTQIRWVHVKDDRMAEMLVQIENILNICNTGQSLLEKIRNHVRNLARENYPILQAPIDVPNVTISLCDEAMDVVTEDIWNHACWRCCDHGHSLFTCPYPTTAQRLIKSVIMRKKTQSSRSSTWRRQSIVQALEQVPVASPVQSPRHAPMNQPATNLTAVRCTV